MDKELLIEYYVNKAMPMKDVAKVLRTSPSRVRKYLKKYKIHIRTRTEVYSADLNLKYFDEITYNNAWILGYTLADGCLTNDNRITYCISPKDIIILEFIRNEICPKNKIYTKKSRIKDKEYTSIILNISNTELFKKMEGFGIHRNKTGTEKLLNIPDKYRNALLRGIFDGDGCIGIYQYPNRSKQYLFQITSASEYLLKEIQIILGVGYVRHRSKPYNCYDLSTNSKKDILKIKKILYSDNGFCLNRKKEIFDKITED